MPAKTALKGQTEVDLQSYLDTEPGPNSEIVVRLQILKRINLKTIK